LTDPWSSGWD